MGGTETPTGDWRATDVGAGAVEAPQAVLRLRQCATHRGQQPWQEANPWRQRHRLHGIDPPIPSHPSPFAGARLHCQGASRLSPQRRRSGAHPHLTGHGERRSAHALRYPKAVIFPGDNACSERGLLKRQEEAVLSRSCDISRSSHRVAGRDLARCLALGSCGAMTLRSWRFWRAACAGTRTRA